MLGSCYSFLALPQNNLSKNSEEKEKAVQEVNNLRQLRKGRKRNHNRFRPLFLIRKA